MHIHRLNHIFIDTVSRYEDRIEGVIKATKVLQKYDTDKQYESDEEIKKKHAELIETAQKEISEDFYSMKSAELILNYSRFESAVNESLYSYFGLCDIAELPSVVSNKMDLSTLLKMNADEQRQYVADIYIQRNSAGIRYGFKRFESIIEPIFGSSTSTIDIRDEIFKFAQIRNLIIHRNGIVDQQFADLFGEAEQKVGQRIDLSREILHDCYHGLMGYADDILDRIGQKQSDLKRVESET
jgi:hypothetical protein